LAPGVSALATSAAKKKASTQLTTTAQWTAETLQSQCSALGFESTEAAFLAFLNGPAGSSWASFVAAKRQDKGAGAHPNLMASAPGVSALVRVLETMEEELAIRIIPEERFVMLLQVSKTMRTAMQRVRPPAMIKVKKGQTFLTESVKNAILGMMKWCRITHINLSNATIGAEGAGRLAAVLGQCASLARLNLERNEIGAEGAGMLAAVLGRCASLAHLELGWNKIGAEGAARLAVVAKHCPSLTVTIYFDRS